MFIEIFTKIYITASEMFFFQGKGLCSWIGIMFKAVRHSDICNAVYEA